MADATVATEKEWTIMVYMAGDNNLSEMMAKAINDAKGMIKQNDKVSLLVYFDSRITTFEPKFYDIMSSINTTNVKDSETFKQLTKGRQSSLNTSENSSSKGSVVNFVNWCIKEKKNRATNYALFFSGHSNAFDEATLLRDNTSKEVLTIPELKQTLAEINEIIKTEEEPDKTLDIIGFDSCVMNLLEIAFQFKGLAKYMIASQGDTPAAGFDYAKILNQSLLDKSNNNEMEAKILSKKIVEIFIEQQKAFLEGGRSADLSAVDLGKTCNVIEKVKALFDLIYDLRKMRIDRYIDKYSDSFKEDEKRDGIKTIVAHQVEKLLLSAHWDCQTYWFEQAIDIYDFCDQLFINIDVLHFQFKSYEDPNSMIFKDILSEVSNACNDVKTVIANEYVITTGSCGADFQFARGSSLFFPWSVKAYREVVIPYLRLDFAKEEDKEAGDFWIKFIEDNLFCSLKRVISKTEKQNPYSVANISTGTSGNGTESGDTRGTSTDKVRGTSTDKSRGTSTDKSRGANFIEAFSSFKNFDPDYWNYIETASLSREIKESEPRKGKLSEDYKNLKLNLDNRFMGKPTE